MAYVKYYIKRLGVQDITPGSWHYMWRLKRTKDGEIVRRRYYRTWADAQEALKNIYIDYAEKYKKYKWQCCLEWEEDVLLIDQTAFIIRSEKHYGSANL
jgi:hypothetical protein